MRKKPRFGLQALSMALSIARIGRRAANSQCRFARRACPPSAVVSMQKLDRNIARCAGYPFQQVEIGCVVINDQDSSRNLVADAQDVGFLRHGLLRPVSEKRMPGKRELAEHQPHHWRAIDRNILSQVASPHCLSPFFPASSNVPERSLKCKITGRRSRYLENPPRWIRESIGPTAVSVPLNSEKNPF